MQSRYEHFTSSISSIYHSIQKIERNEMIRYGGKGIYAQYLAALYRHPEGLTAAQLSDLCDRDKAAVSRAITAMEEMRLVIRAGREENMYRANVRLTEAGQQAAEYVTRQAQAAVEAGGQGLDTQEREKLQEALALIAANLEVICKEGIPQR